MPCARSAHTDAAGALAGTSVCGVSRAQIIQWQRLHHKYIHSINALSPRLSLTRLPLRATCHPPASATRKSTFPYNVASTVSAPLVKLWTIDSCSASLFSSPHLWSSMSPETDATLKWTCNLNCSKRLRCCGFRKYNGNGHTWQSFAWFMCSSTAPHRQIVTALLRQFAKWETFAPAAGDDNAFERHSN